MFIRGWKSCSWKSWRIGTVLRNYSHAGKEKMKIAETDSHWQWELFMSLENVSTPVLGESAKNKDLLCVWISFSTNKRHKEPWEVANIRTKITWCSVTIQTHPLLLYRSKWCWTMKKGKLLIRMVPGKSNEIKELLRGKRRAS